MIKINYECISYLQKALKNIFYWIPLLYSFVYREFKASWIFNIIPYGEVNEALLPHSCNRNLRAHIRHIRGVDKSGNILDSS